MANRNISTDALASGYDVLPEEFNGLSSYKVLVPFAFRHESMDRAHETFDNALLDLLSGIDNREKLAKMTGIMLSQDHMVCF